MSKSINLLTLVLLMLSIAGCNQNQSGTTGKQVWATKNLDVSTFRNGDPIPKIKSDEEWIKAGENGQAAWCYYENDPANGEKYGKLFNWYAVKDPRGLCPTGWHVPSDADWTVLTDYLGGEDAAWVKMKSTSAFAVERISASPETLMYNLSLAGLGSLYNVLLVDKSSGKIRIDLDKDEVKTTLTDDNLQRTIRSYSVLGKVLAADLIGTDKFQNHFLIASASLGIQLVKAYEFGQDAFGRDVVLTNDSIKEFFFSIHSGKIEIQVLNGHFDISDITNTFS